MVVNCGTNQTMSLGKSEFAQLTTREINPQLDPRWESFVRQHPDASIYHHPAWLAALHQEYERRGVYLICEDSCGKLLGLFPLMYTRGLPFSKGRPLTEARLVSLPRTPLGGPLTTDPRATALLLQEALRRVSSKRPVRLQIKTQKRDLIGLVNGIVEKPWRFTYMLQLPESQSEPFRISNSKNRAKINWSINKAATNGLRVRLAETENDLELWYWSYLETMRRNAVPARSYRFFLALWELMRPKGLLKVFLAEQHNTSGSRIIGGHFYFYLGQTMTYAFSASRTNDLSLRPNDIILWQSINDAHRNGFRIVDLGEVPEGDDTLAQFKSKWGAEPVRLYRYYYPDFTGPNHFSDGTETFLVRIAVGTWRHLPLGMTSWLGDRIYSRL